MPPLPSALNLLLQSLTLLPGIGRRGAERIALKLLESPEDQATQLAQALQDLHRNCTRCPSCGTWAEHDRLCSICSDPARDSRQLCVVERAPDMWAFEQSDAFNGHYHILGGSLSPLNGVTAEDLRLKELLARINNENVQELILATSPSVDGDATAHYIADCLAGSAVRISRIARGVPVGCHLDYADAGTLRSALEGRRLLNENE
jgi:recombination protein RecR